MGIVRPEDYNDEGMNASSFDPRIWYLSKTFEGELNDEKYSFSPWCALALDLKQPVWDIKAFVWSWENQLIVQTGRWS